MKVVVRTAFTDKYTKEIYKPGRILDLTKKRIDEIKKANEKQRPDLTWIEVVEDTEAKTEEVKDTEAKPKRKSGSKKEK